MSQVGTGTWKNLIWKVKNLIWKNLNSGFTKTVKLYNLSLHVYKMGVLCAVINRSVQFSSVAQLCPTLCDPMNRSTPGLLVHHQLLEPTETHVHRVSDAIQPSHPLSSPSPPALNPSQHQSSPMSQLFT